MAACFKKQTCSYTKSGRNTCVDHHKSTLTYCMHFIRQAGSNQKTGCTSRI